MFLSTIRECAYAVDYNSLVSMLQAKSRSTRVKGKDLLADAIKNDLFHDERRNSEDRVYVSHLTTNTKPDVALSISYPPYQGTLVILTAQNGRYVPTQLLTRLGFIASLEGVKLFPGSLEQLVVNMSGGGTGWRHWAKDIYRWDGKVMRIIWSGFVKDVTTDFPPPEGNEAERRVIKSNISFRDLDRDGVKEIIAAYEKEEGLVGARALEIKNIKSRTSWKEINRWDETFYYYIAQYARITATIVARCSDGLSFNEWQETITDGTRAGVLVTPDFREARQKTATIVLSKKQFCELPKSSLRLEP
jgi:hypothetical protein